MIKHESRKKEHLEKLIDANNLALSSKAASSFQHKQREEKTASSKYKRGPQLNILQFNKQAHFDILQGNKYYL